MSELENPTRAAVLAGLSKAALFDRYQARREALKLAVQLQPDATPDDILATAQRFYDFTLDIAGPEQVQFGKELADA